MKTKFLRRPVCTFVLVLSLLVPSIPTSSAAAASLVDPNVVYVNNFEGWGTSLAWGGNVVGGWSDPKRTAIADLLFSPTGGLGLNIVRYHIGGGLNPNWQAIGCGQQRPGSPLPLYEPGQDVWDWTVDANQRWLAQAAQARGANLFLAYASAPPYWMTINGCTNGGDNGGSNLQSAYYDDFADHLTEVVKHFRDVWGITFNYLDPLNEPGATWWTKTCNQEGNHFSEAEQNDMVILVGQSLAAKGLSETTVAAPDNVSPGDTNSAFNSYSSSAKGYVSVITTHTYWTSATEAASLRTTAASNGKKLWMSEFSTGGGISFTDPNHVQPAISLAARIVGDMNDLRPSAWLLWDGIESWDQNNAEGSSWGAIWAYYLNGSETYTVAKQYYGYKNFTQFIRPGYRIISGGDAQSLAAYDPVGKQLVIVTYNDASTSRSATYDLSMFNAISTATPYRTSSTQNLAQLASVSLTNNRLTVTLPAKSATTYVMTNAIPVNMTTVNDNTTGTGLNQFEYQTSAWGYYASEPGAYMMDNHWSGTKNDYYLVDFNGTQVKVYAARAPNHGKAAISIDGGTETTLDLYNSTRQDQYLIWTSPVLPAGSHTLKVRVTGAKNRKSSGVYVPADRVDIYP